MKKLIVTLIAIALLGCNAGTTSPTSSQNTASPSSKSFRCQGSYIGSVDMPPENERIAARNEGMKRKGIPITGNDAIDDPAQGGGQPNGGMWLSGSFDFTADTACNVTGQVLIFGYPFNLTGQVQPDGSFTLNYLEPLFIGKVNADKSVTGKLFHGGGEEYIYGYINGKFVQK